MNEPTSNWSFRHWPTGVKVLVVLLVLFALLAFSSVVGTLIDPGAE